jgi:hypothetical protein
LGADVNNHGQPPKKNPFLRRQKGSRGQGCIPAAGKQRPPANLPTDFSSQPVTGPPKDGGEVLERTILTTERNRARDLGNLERIEKWQHEEFFGAARREWLDALRRLARKHGLGSLYEIRARVPQTPEPEKAFTLTSLRLSHRPGEVLRNRATVIKAAALAGDIEFFRQLGRVLVNHSRTQRDSSFLSYSILIYWFAGLLWLMGDKMGACAVSAYTGGTVETDAYRKARERLGLQGYRPYVKAAPVLTYDAETKSYQYGRDWT